MRATKQLVLTLLFIFSKTIAQEVASPSCFISHSDMVHHRLPPWSLRSL